MRLLRARLSENFLMSAHRGALCFRAAMSFSFFPRGFLDDIFKNSTPYVFGDLKQLSCLQMLAFSA